MCAATVGNDPATKTTCIRQSALIGERRVACDLSEFNRITLNFNLVCFAMRRFKERKSWLSNCAALIYFILTGARPLRRSAYARCAPARRRRGSAGYAVGPCFRPKLPTLSSKYSGRDARLSMLHLQFKDCRPSCSADHQLRYDLSL
jgi:hypothetical protein